MKKYKPALAILLLLFCSGIVLLFLNIIFEIFFLLTLLILLLLIPHYWQLCRAIYMRICKSEPNGWYVLISFFQLFILYSIFIFSLTFKY